MKTYTIRLSGDLTVEIEAKSKYDASMEARRIFDKRLKIDCLYGLKLTSNINGQKVPVRVIGFAANNAVAP